MPAPITAVSQIALPEIAAPRAGGGDASGFHDLLAGAVQAIEGSRADAAQKVESFLKGEGQELHTAVLATQQAELSFELGLQVRNKIVQAYQQIMQMQM